VKYMLVDGNSLTYRAFFALPTDLMTASGQVTNAVYGFTSMLANLLRDHRPDVVAVAFDRPEPTFRHEMVEGYKANRDEAPDILRQQLGLVHAVVEALGLPLLEQPGLEADDIIATLATEARDRGDEVLVVTGDRDSYQLVEDPLIRVLYNKRGVSEYALYDEAGIRERTGVHPTDYVTYAALRGDPSDNLPGVPGVGEKTAAKLVNAYGDLDGIFAHVEEQTPKLRQNLAEHEQRVRDNERAMVLVRDATLPLHLHELAHGEVDRAALAELIDFLEFHSLVDRLHDAMGLEAPAEVAEAAVSVEVRVAEHATEAVTWLTAPIDGARLRCVDASWSGRPGVELAGLAVVLGGPGAEIDATPGAFPDSPGEAPASGAWPVGWVPAGLLDAEGGERIIEALAGPDARLATHDAKPLVRWLIGRSQRCRGLVLDSMLAAYLLDPADASDELEHVVERYTASRLEMAAGTVEGQLALDVNEPDDPSLAAAGRAAAVALLVPPLTAALEAQGLRSLHDDVEIPLVGVLARMEHLGVGVDEDELRSLNQRLAREAEQLTTRIWEEAGEQFKVNSTPQLRVILFDKLGLTPQKKTKTGYSTDAASLEKIRHEHPVVELLLRYREVEKLRSTYGEGLLAEIAGDGRIHATFNQTVARTGRLSSDRPNLHNIPVRTEEGRAFRRAFVPAQGFDLLVADYNQIELRCIAHLAEDPGLLAAFASDTDIHTETAARVFGVDPEAVTGGQRAKAKMVSYGLAYGMEAYGLGQRLAVPTSEAQSILDAYFEAFPNVAAYMEATVAEARERGYTETLFGRRRRIPELSSPNHRIRQAGERQAMNAGIQGLAADIFKVALVSLDGALDEADLESRLILQVHDEVILEVPPTEHDEAAEVTLAAMHGAYELRVPLEVNLAFGPSWADAK
jgi:DNA polymerase I